MKTPRTSDSVRDELNRLLPDGVTTPVAASTERAIRDQLISSLEPVRVIPSRASLVIVFLSIFAAVTAVLMGFFGTRGAVAMTVPQLAGILTAIVVAASLAATSIAREMSPGDRRIFHPGTMTAGILLALLALLIGLFPWSDGPLGGWHCFSSGFFCSLPSVALVLFVIRSGSPLAWGAIGAAAGLLGGLVGMAAIHVGCSMLNAPHMAVGHLSIPLAGTVVGYLTGKALPLVLPPRPHTA